jgi:hypothetical protein
MRTHWLTILFFLVPLFGLNAACAQQLSRGPDESDLAFAEHALHLTDEADPHVTAAAWNGVKTIFVDYVTGGDDAARLLVALQETPGGGFRKLDVTTGEQEGAIPDVVAIGFANADRDPAKELIVILTWPQRHYDVEGDLYEVRIFDDPKVAQSSLTLLKISDEFGFGCECASRDGKTTHFHFKTIAAVKAKLSQLGY